MDSVQVKPLQEDLKYFYEKILIEGFPNKDELDKFEDLVDYKLNQSATHNFNIWGIYYDGELAGGIVFDHYKDSNDLLIEYISISSHFRNKGLATILVEKAISDIECDYVIIEVEDPIKNLTIENINRERFWKNRGFRKVKFNYIQPAISDEKEEVNGLMIMCLVKNRSLASNQIDANRLKKILKNYFLHSMKLKSEVNIEEILSFDGNIIEIEE